jgi:hypothetical protein
MSFGRPTKYKAEYARQAYKACALGATDSDLAELFDVETSTIALWKIKHRHFSDAIKTGKAETDSLIEKSLVKRAMGFEVQDKIFPPDTTACIFWLKNRKPKDWRDKTEVEHSGNFVQDLAIEIVRQRKKGVAVTQPG